MIKLNGVVLFEETFPNGEPAVLLKDMDIYNTNVIDFRYESDADLMHLYLLQTELRNFSPLATTTLDIAYMPYSRMDRRNTHMFTLKSICQMINDLRFAYVRVLEPHSDVTSGLLDRMHPVDGTFNLIERAMREGFLEFDVSRDTICFPDSSAAKRYHGLLDCNTVTMEKHRDFETGKLTDMKMYGEIPINSRVLIVDDLCSAGGTFQWAADIMRGHTNINFITLLVAHCETAVLKGLDKDTNQIDQIVTTDSIIQHKDLASTEDDKVLLYNYKKVML